MFELTRDVVAFRRKVITLHAYVKVLKTTPGCRETLNPAPKTPPTASGPRQGLFSASDRAAEQASLSKMPARSPEEALAMMETVLGNSMPIVIEGTGKVISTQPARTPG